jgi:protein FLOWERING LOCUS T
MPHSVTNKSQLRYGPFSVSDYPDKISDSTVALAYCRAIPDIIDSVSDQATLQVTYTNTLKIENAMRIDPEELLEQPAIQIHPKTATPPRVYTLMIVDPDVPTPNNPKLRSFLHWLVINIPPHDIPRGEEVVPYEPPSPSPGGGKRGGGAGTRIGVAPPHHITNKMGPGSTGTIKGHHRLVFLLFEQNGRVTARPPSSRKGFQVRSWCASHGGISGEPASGLFVWTGEERVKLGVGVAEEEEEEGEGEMEGEGREEEE